MKYRWLIFSSLALAGCMASNALQYESMSETNLYHLAMVRKGMSEKQILQIMHKPYSYESFQVDDDIYDVWFYVTRSTGLDQTRMVPQNLTPLTFKNGILVGTGYNWYYYAMKEQTTEMQAQQPAPKPQPSQKQEDEEFEKLLRTPPKKTAEPTKMAPENKGLEKALNIPKSKTAPEKPTSPNKKKLPPNVHIISESSRSLCPGEDACASDRFSSLSKGMSELQVFKVFGAPAKYETFEYMGDVYDVWFYETIPSKTGKPSIVPQHLTPITFKNAILLSMQEDDFYELKEKVKTQFLQEESEEQVSKASMTSPTLLKPYIPKSNLAISQKSYFKTRNGMTEEQVKSSLGEPIEKESLKVGEDTYETWFYSVSSLRKKVKYLPITFKNGKVSGHSMKYYNSVRQKAGLGQIDCYTPAAERMQEEESNQNFNYW